MRAIDMLPAPLQISLRKYVGLLPTWIVSTSVVQGGQLAYPVFMHTPLV